jgi:hypothetical protein
MQEEEQPECLIRREQRRIFIKKEKKNMYRAIDTK